MPMLTSEIMFWKSALHNYVHIYAYIVYTCEKLFAKTLSLNLAMTLQAQFLEWHLACFWEKSSSFLDYEILSQHLQLNGPE